jgi:hypothetical protein
MRLMGFSFTKLNLEKKSDDYKELKITTGIDITNLIEAKLDIFKSSENLLAVSFKYVINYEKDVASFNFEGSLIVSVDSKQFKEVLRQWKDKKLPEDFKLGIFNIILKKSSLKALQFEEEFSLPPHIPLPSFKAAENDK